MFKQNDYIVTLKVDTSFSTVCAKDNWCFKQKRYCQYIIPCIDLLGSTNTINSNLQFDKSKGLKDWRYATPEEIAEYDRLGKPFDVTTLKPKELSKEELLEEAKRKYPIGSQVKSVFEDLLDTVKEQSHINYPDARYEDASQIWFTGNEYGLLIYDKGKWAEIVSKPESVEKIKEPKFVVGKWYKRTTTPTSNEFVLYIKCFSIDPIKDCEHITLGGKHNVIVTQGRGYKEWKVLEDLLEIQQYLPEGHPDKFPVSKELTSLPEKWCIAVTKESEPVLSEWRDAGSLTVVHGYCLSYYNNAKGWWKESKSPSEWPEYTEITFDQFKKWVLKESSEVSLVGRYLKALVDSPHCTSFTKDAYVKILEKISDTLYRTEKDWFYNTNNIIAYQWELMPEGFTPPVTGHVQPEPSSQMPEYVECIEAKSNCFKVGRIYTFPNPVRENGRKSDVGILNGSIWKFKPSTKEAYEAQQKPQTMVQKWAVGTYVVFLKNYGGSRVGMVDKIIRNNEGSISCKREGLTTQDPSFTKWFATEKEAEEFAKTLRELEPMTASVGPEWTPQIGEWVMDSLNIPFKLTHSADFAWYGTKADGSSYSEIVNAVRKALPHEIPSEQTSVKVDTGKKMDSAKTESPIPESPKFKAGDRVRIVKEATCEGHAWTTEMNDYLGKEMIVESLSNIGSCRLGDWYFRPESLELVSPVLSVSEIVQYLGKSGVWVDTAYLDMGIQYIDGKMTSGPQTNEPITKIRRLGTTTI